MRISEIIKNYLVQLAIEDRLPMDLTQLDLNEIDEVIEKSGYHVFIKLEHYLSSYPGVEKTIQLLKEAQEKDMYMHIEEIDGISVWEPLEGRYSVDDFCEILGI